MDLVRAGTTRWGCEAAFSAARALPRRWAYAMGEWLFGRVASRPELPLPLALRANLAVVLGLPEEDPEVARGVTLILRYACHSYVDLARASKRGSWAVAQRCRLQPEILDSLDDALGARQGVVLAGAHTCSFDFLLTALSRRFPDVLLLTKPNPTGSSRVMNQLRIDLGLDLSPISAASLREAVRRLRQGGIVVLAADVPLRGPGGLTFFGRPCRLSDGFARIALSAGARLMVGFSHQVGDGEYEGLGELVPPPPPGLGRQEEARRWAQKGLVRLEALLAQYPEEWLMPERVWATSAEVEPAAASPQLVERPWSDPVGLQTGRRHA